MIRIPVARPRMPPVEALLPLLRQIDSNRSYTNFGPLVGRLEARLAARLGVDPACVVTVSNATAGLTFKADSAAYCDSCSDCYCHVMLLICVMHVVCD